MKPNALKTVLLHGLLFQLLTFAPLMPLVRPTLSQETRKLTAENPQEFASFGYDVALDGDTLVVSAYSEAVNGLPTAGAVYVYRRHGGAAWSQEARLTAADARAGGLFGVSVAIDNNSLVAGAIGQGDNDQPYAGAAYVFTRQNGQWSQEAKLVSAEPSSGDYLGQDVAIDNHTALVGMFGNDGHDGALIFNRTAGAWSLHTKLTSSAPDVGHFGAHVALHGNFALVGAYDEDIGEFADAGAVYAYVRGADGRWWSHAKLTAPDIQTGQWFGAAVAIRDNLAVIGSPFWDNEFASPGTAYVFNRSGSAWTAAAPLAAPEPSADGSMGHAVAIGKDYLVVGAPGLAAAYLFQHNQLWQTLTPSDGQGSDNFGYAVAASSLNIAAGAPLASPGGITYAGAAYLFRP